MTSGASGSVIRPRQLRQAREGLRLSIEEACNILRVPPAQLRNWESGVLEPPVEQLWALAELYGRDVGYFLEDTEPVPERVAFRLAKPQRMERLSLEAGKVLARFEELCRAEMELEALLEKQRTIRIEKVGGPQDPEVLAQVVREDFGLGQRPGKKLRAMLEGLGIRVFELEVPIDGSFSGFSWWHGQYGPCILANYRDIPGRRAFTESHELGHLLLGDEPGVCAVHEGEETAEDGIADRFAAALLMPARDVEPEFLSRGFLPGSIDDKQLGLLAAHYGVSMQAMAWKLESLRPPLLPRGFTNSKIQQWAALPKHYRSPILPKWQKQLGEPFVTLAKEAYLRGLVSLGTLAHYLGIDAREARRFARADTEPLYRGRAGR